MVLTSLNWLEYALDTTDSGFLKSSLGKHLTVNLRNTWRMCKSFQATIKASLTIRVAAAAKSLQSCPTLCDPIDGSPPGSPIPGILQA